MRARPVPAMAFPGEAWERVTPEEVRVDARSLGKAVAWFEDLAPGNAAENFVIVRYGRVIWEGPKAGEAWGTWSVTKAFTSTVFGLLVGDGLCDPGTRVAEILPEMESAYPEVTMGHLMAMVSGYEAVGDWPPLGTKNQIGGGLTPFDPSPEPQFAPGRRFSYWDSGMNVFGLALTKLGGESMRALFQRRIGSPIGMASDAWDWGKFTEWDGIAVHGGSGNKGKHVVISARDLARFGHLMLTRGRWKDRQLIDESWVDLATSIQVPEHLPLGGPIRHRYGKTFHMDGRGVYGFNWWVNGVQPDGKRLWPGVPEATFGAIGFKNQRMFIIPEWHMVVVRLGRNERERRIHRREFAGFLRRIGKAIH